MTFVPLSAAADPNHVGVCQQRRTCHRSLLFAISLCTLMSTSSRIDVHHHNCQGALRSNSADTNIASPSSTARPADTPPYSCISRSPAATLHWLAFQSFSGQCAVGLQHRTAICILNEAFRSQHIASPRSLLVASPATVQVRLHVVTYYCLRGGASSVEFVVVSHASMSMSTC